MKLISLILICALFSLIEIFLFVILLEKANNIILSIISFVLSMLVLFVGSYGIFTLGKFWDMEFQVKNLLGVCCSIVIIASLIYAHIKK